MNFHLQKFLDPRVTGYVVFTESDPAAFIVDPGNHWREMRDWLSEKGLLARCILLSQVTFDHALRVASIQQETGAQFLAFANDLLLLRMLPRWADERNVCGIKIPHVDRILDDSGRLEWKGFELGWTGAGDRRSYTFGKLSVPEK